MSQIELIRADPEAPARLAALSDEELIVLQYDWSMWRRPDQDPPAWKWVNWLILAGRGFGKTRVGAEQVRQWIKDGRNYVNLIGPTADDLRDVMVEGESGILSICPNHERPVYRVSKRRLEWPNGAISLLFSAQEPERLRGKQGTAAWADEIASWQYQQEAWDQLQFGLRLGTDPKIVITTTPRPTKLIRDLIADPNTATTRGTTYANRANLAPTFYSAIIKRYEGSRLGRQELLAEVLDDNPGALWKLSDIDATRVYSLPPLIRIVVAIDPAVTSTEESDETGIVVAGMDARDPAHFYVIEDKSGTYTPDEWAKMAVKLYHQWEADRIVGEVNNGGDMVETVIRHQDANVSYKSVHASRGKTTRAEPVSALYEQRRVHHLGTWAKLEDQMIQFVPGIDNGEDDRSDSLVWAITELASGTNGWAGFVKDEAKGLFAAGLVPKLDGTRVNVAGGNRDRCACGSVAWAKIDGRECCFKCRLPRPEL